MSSINPNKSTKKYLNYGHIHKGTKRYRSALRECRKRGFDDTELWNFDCTFSKFVLSHGYLKGHKELLDKIIECDLTIMHDEREGQYRIIADEISANQEICDKCRQFIIPRLIRFIEIHRGYPPIYKTDEGWRNKLTEIIEDIKVGNFTEFMLNLENMWD